MKKRKPRGIKLNGEPSLDMCTCYSFYCDPFSVSSEFSSKIQRRRDMGVHPACGHNPCTCKSSLAAGKRYKHIDFKPREINEDVVKAIRIDKQLTYQQWADILDVPKRVIYEIKKGITWKGVRI